MVEYLPEHLETAVISQLTFICVYRSFSVTSKSSLPLNVFLSLKPSFAALDPAHYKKNSQQRAPLAYFLEKAARCLLALLKTYMEIIFLQSKQSE